MGFLLLKSATDVLCAGNNGLGHWIVDAVKKCNEPEPEPELGEAKPPQQKPEAKPQQTKPQNNNVSFGG